MSLISPLFLFVCFPLALIIYSFIPKSAKKPAIAAFCLLFYLIANVKNPIAPILLVFTVIAVFFFARIIDGQRGKKRVMTAYSCSLLFLLAFIVLRFAEPLEINLSAFAYPFGASVWLLAAISCIFDVERGDAPPPTIVDAVAYVAYFPIMAAGPILKYREYVDAFADIDFSFARMAKGAEYFMLGFIKRFAVAHVLWQLVGAIGENAANGIGVIVIIEYLVIVPIAVYAYFSGFSDMGIGVSMLFGIKLPENFNAPLSAQSPLEYAKRFMSSLYGFASDYIGYVNPSKQKNKISEFCSGFSIFIFIFLWYESDPITLALLLPVAAALAAGLIGRAKRGRSRAVNILCRAATFFATSLFWGFLSLSDVFDLAVLGEAFSKFRFGAGLLLYGVSMSKYLIAFGMAALTVLIFDRVVRGHTGKLSGTALLRAKVSVNITLLSMFVFTMFFYYPQIPSAFAVLW